MAFVHSKSTRILVNEFHASAKLRSITAENSRALGDVTSFLDEGNKFIPGLRSSSMNIEGMFEDDTFLTELRDADGVNDAMRLSAGFAGFAVGNPVVFAQGNLADHGITASVTEPVAFTVGPTPNEISDIGVSLHDHTAETATGNGAAVDNTDATTGGGAGILHVTAATGTTPNLAVKIQHSVDNSVWVDLITFTAATAATSERLTVSGTVNRYVRAIRTVSGTTPSFTYVVAFARR